MNYTILVTWQYLKRIVMPIRYLTLRIQNLLVDKSSHLVQQLSYENHLNKHESQDL
jgi:hypothetical protein